MNCPSRTDFDETGHQGWNQQPNQLAADSTTREDLNGVANSRQQRGHRTMLDDQLQEEIELQGVNVEKDKVKSIDGGPGKSSIILRKGIEDPTASKPENVIRGNVRTASAPNGFSGVIRKSGQVVVKYLKFVGPGAMLSVAYIDPGNYATDVAAGATYRFRLLFVVLLSNLFAIFLQSLCVRLGSVTGLNLAENCKAHLPPWLNYFLYFMAESAIIATDIAEVIGTAIALDLLLHIPLVAGCAISIVDVLIILFFYKPSGNMRAIRTFEIFVLALVLGVVVCFCFQLSLIKDTSIGEVFRGYLPSKALIESKGQVVPPVPSDLADVWNSIYQACGILGATVMPHSLYLGSGIIQARLHDYDVQNGNVPEPYTTSNDHDDQEKYRPSLEAIRSCMSYSVAELAISLFTFALFVNSAILIVAGASLSNNPNAGSADLFGIHDLLSSSLAPAAGTIFALALLLSGTSAGIVCTIAGQMVSEGQLNWRIAPWMRRLITRCISILPSIVIAGAVGKKGLSAALEGSQVALSVILPFVSAPLIYFTCRNRYMTVQTGSETDGAVKMRNGWVTTVLAVLIWGFIVVINGALLVLVGLGVD